jgi:AcrR family transcriptional regulator
MQTPVSDVPGNSAIAPRPGRPRSVEADEAILSAAIHLFATEGFDGMSVDDIATRAGVSKATIYRRYPTKTDLVIAATRRCGASDETRPDTGSLRGDLAQWMRSFVKRVRHSDMGRVYPRLLAEIQTNEALAKMHREFVSDKRDIVKAMLKQGIARGEFAKDADLDLVADLLSAPVFYRAYTTGQPLSEKFTTELIDAILRAFHA